MPDHNSTPVELAEHARPTGPGLRDVWSRALIRRLERVTQGRLTLIAPDRSVQCFGRPAAEPAASVAIHDPRVARNLVLGGSIGFAEAYMDGVWDSPDIVALIGFAIANERALGLDADGHIALRLIERVRHVLHRNSRRGSRYNIAYHYDLGNAFYAAWLDRGMTYSAAMFAAPDESLETAQARKYHEVAALLELAPGQSLLEIGCGWGGFAELAAGDYRCKVTGLTLSRTQRDYAQDRLVRQELGARAAITLADYRDAAGSYDRIASIEMIEAVGEKHWPVYFARLRRLLAPGGIAVLQAITIADERFESYRRCPDFIQRHIFPGGMLPSRATLHRAAAAAGLALVEGVRFGQSYAHTLALWQQRFQAAWPRIAALGFDRRFKRMWEYYLAYCEAGFRTGTLDVALYRFEHAVSGRSPV